MFFGRKKEEKAREWVKGLSEEEYQKYARAILDLYRILKDTGLSEQEIYEEIARRLNLEVEKVVVLFKDFLDNLTFDKIFEMATGRKINGQGSVGIPNIQGGSGNSFGEVSQPNSQNKNQFQQPSERELLMEILKELKQVNSNLKAMIVRMDTYQKRNEEHQRYVEERLDDIFSGVG